MLTTSHALQSTTQNATGKITHCARKSGKGKYLKETKHIAG